MAAATSLTLPGKSGFLFDLQSPPSTVDSIDTSEFREAWGHARNVELEGHRTAGTFEMAALPKARKAVTANWLFSCKTGKYGMVTKTKARLVARGFTQVTGVDFRAK